jgi:hypothetical protein
LAYAGYVAGSETLIKSGYELQWFHQAGLGVFSLLFGAALLYVPLFILMLIMKLVSRKKVKRDRR